MLKIKENLDLKELEKFGFEYQKGGKINYYEKMIQYFPLGDSVPCLRYYLTVNEENKHIYSSIFDLTWEGKNDHYNIEFLDDLYDLIKADLVEKVEEE